MKKRCVVVVYSYALADPPVVQACASLAAEGWEVLLLHGTSGGIASDPPPGVGVREWRDPAWRVPRFARQLLRWAAFRSEVRRTVRASKPDLMVTIMLHALAALPRSRVPIVSCIYDIPPPSPGGKLDAVLNRRAWRRLSRASIVWSSDPLKARWAAELGGLSRLPLVVHNCPGAEAGAPEPRPPRDAWLRAELRASGAALPPEGGLVLLRAGAVGPWGGIEETIRAVGAVPGVVFLMMGRPRAEYARGLRSQIQSLGLSDRVFLWELPDDATWARALGGADAGHLVHGPFPQGREGEAYRYNSSLSTNRLFQYMKAGLPIIVDDDPRLAAIRQEVPCFSVVRQQALEVDFKATIQELRDREDLRLARGIAGWTAHRATYNWETQFAPVVAAIEALETGDDGENSR